MFCNSTKIILRWLSYEFLIIYINLCMYTWLAIKHFDFHIIDFMENPGSIWNAFGNIWLMEFRFSREDGLAIIILNYKGVWFEDTITKYLCASDAEKLTNIENTKSKLSCIRNSGRILHSAQTWYGSRRAVFQNFLYLIMSLIKNNCCERQELSFILKKNIRLIRLLISTYHNAYHIFTLFWCLLVITRLPKSTTGQWALYVPETFPIPAYWNNATLRIMTFS